jgi:hypothetical protein
MTEYNSPEGGESRPKMPPDGSLSESGAGDRKDEGDAVTGRGFGEVGDSRSPGDVEINGETRVADRTADDSCEPLFDTEHVKGARARWHDIQAGFVDDPHAALRRAAELNDEIISALASALETRKRALQEGVASADTEQLRIGLRRYHQLLDHILAL